ncbi:LysR family transcriptional regulator [Caenimonas aquaedulcis]|uniref:LysR family transcriptional regulator n=1 Tax=Caenimonas aquaedulcis TaxID=2793270 RepID=A0A931MG45_9BURK|nr:LysR family transcriptional regulator [Caenimonas aquaedulcis]MBG9387753.1 LysR family transcriptional regulator [Caenimonas aquaedulcis]
MDLRRMSHLVALEEERNFGRAAERVHVTQPAFSRSVQAAEAELGLLLFERGPLQVRPTAAGTFVVERARKLLFDNHCLQRDIGLFRGRQLGNISFGVGPFPAATLLEPLMRELRAKHPAVQVRVEVNNWKYLAEHLRVEEIDFFVADIRDVPRDGDLAIKSIGRQRGRFYVRTGHPLLARRNLKPAAMAAYGLASVRLPNEMKAVVCQLLGLATDAALPVVLECDDVHLLKRVALTSDTVLASTDPAVQEEVKAGRLHALSLRGLPALYNEMGIVSLLGRSHSPMAEVAVKFLASAARAGSALNS